MFNENANFTPGAHPLKALREQISQENHDFDQEMDLYEGLNTPVPD